ncbi:1-acyl-sn-glycerol-3-phosphate acyltransferase [Ekhidna sp.]|uniref:1-acyl-sn-glycerol-3-phosphate acyltransferase n=1 Tax=Ekhidna sp. TaxID=2608089 RepID=UPI003298D8B1
MLRSYFHKIRIEGKENVPKNTPLIVIPNHQNAFLDAILVGAFIPIPLHYLTRQDVFTWWSKPLLRLMNMMPIYRIRDGFSKLSLNDAVFESCRNLFGNHGSVLIFAEGNHGKDYYLRPLTKGAARLALQSQEAIDTEMMVLPVGLNYFNHQAANSTVLINFGKPIPVKEYVKSYQTNAAKGLIEIRNAISTGMKEVLVIPDMSPEYDLRVQAIFQEKHEDLSFHELQSIDITETIIEDKKQKKKHHLAWILNPLPLLIIRKVISGIDDVVFHSSLKFGIGLFAFPLWWVIVFFTMFFLVGINIALLTVIVMVYGLYYSYQR